MKSESLSSRRSTAAQGKAADTAIAGSANTRGAGSSRACLPIEWMDPMSWRLPSGKALAEFALQAGFLAPLVLNSAPSKQSGKRAAAWRLSVAPAARNHVTGADPGSGQQPVPEQVSQQRGGVTGSQIPPRRMR